MSILLRALISRFGAWLVECACSRGVLLGFHCCVLLSLFRPPHSLCWGSLLGAHPQHLAAGDPGKIHTGTARGGGGKCSGSVQKKKGTLVAFGVSKHCRGKEGGRHCSTRGVVADTCLPLDLHLSRGCGSRKRILQGVKKLGRVIALLCGNSCSTVKMLTLEGSLCHHQAALGGLHRAGRARLRACRQVGRAGRKEAALELCNLPAGFARGSCAQKGRLKLIWELC